jgi:ABC-type multidrug transport system fused ATPase/permease subunit
MTRENGGLGRIAASYWVLAIAFRTAKHLTIAIAICNIALGVLPAAVAYVGKWIVDAVVVALTHSDGWGAYKRDLWSLIAIEGALVSCMVFAQRIHTAAQTILKTRLANRVTELILEKASALDLRQFEDPEVHDRLMRARRDAATRPYNLVSGSFITARNLMTLTACVVVLLELSYWAVLIVLLAGLPAFIAELRFSQQIFDHQRIRSPEQREQAYLEQLLSREDFAKEVKLYELIAPLLERFRAISRHIAAEERAITIRRNAWGAVFTVLGTTAFYLAYAWIVHRTVNEHLTLGQMTMYLVIFRQAQQGVTNGLASIGLMLDDYLYLQDLRAFLSLEVTPISGTVTQGTDPTAGLVVERLSFTYPGASRPALDDISFTLKPSEMVALVGHNGSGKTTLLKLMTRLYEPTRGRILLDGVDIREWDPNALRRRFALVFQDFVRFKMTAGENIGVGDTRYWTDMVRWETAAKRGLAHDFITLMKAGYRTPLGKWFRGGQELSGGQWQRIALSRAFMRGDESILVLDEPTSALDPEAEIKIFEHVHATRADRMVMLISHRFGSVRMADRIIVLDQGTLVEEGSHESLMERDGLYARLFKLQAAGLLGTRSSRPASFDGNIDEDRAMIEH